MGIKNTIESDDMFKGFNKILVESYHDLNTLVIEAGYINTVETTWKKNILVFSDLRVLGNIDKNRRLDLIVHNDDAILHTFFNCRPYAKSSWSDAVGGDKFTVKFDYYIHVFREYDLLRHYMNDFKKLAVQSTCKSKSVSAVVVKNARVVGRGYNGPPSGKCGNKCPRQEVGFKSGEGMLYCPSIHGEQRAIQEAGDKARGATLYADCGLPCYRCMGSIVAAKISKVVCMWHENNTDMDNDYMFKKSAKLAFDNDVEVIYCRIRKK